LSWIWIFEGWAGAERAWAVFYELRAGRTV